MDYAIIQKNKTKTKKTMGKKNKKQKSHEQNNIKQ